MNSSISGIKFYCRCISWSDDDGNSSFINAERRWCVNTERERANLILKDFRKGTALLNCKPLLYDHAKFNEETIEAVIKMLDKLDSVDRIFAEDE